MPVHAILDAVLALLPPHDEPGLTPAEIFKEYRMWAPGTTHMALWQLMREGRVTREDDPMGRRLYRRAPDKRHGLLRGKTNG
jgi:hypothetical protein